MLWVHGVRWPGRPLGGRAIPKNPLVRQCSKKQSSFAFSGHVVQGEIQTSSARATVEVLSDSPVQGILDLARGWQWDRPLGKWLLCPGGSSCTDVAAWLIFGTVRTTQPVHS